MADEDKIPDALVSDVGLIPELETIVARIRHGEKTLKFKAKELNPTPAEFKFQENQ